jgi:excisionase family DNA binding protein
MLKVKDVAEQLGVAQGTVYQLCASGKIVHLRIGRGRGAIRIEPAAVADYVEAVRVRTPEMKPGEFRHLKL